MSDKIPIYTLAEGCPIASSSTAQTFRSRSTPASSTKSLALLQDTQLIETLAHFSRERIPERVVHARAVGAWGEFEVTKDISTLTSAKFLNGVVLPVIYDHIITTSRLVSSRTHRSIR
ncbi:hypothetical protein VE01_06197 [Pseudogymnoascus verrucosus]|uniref:Catalase core domain-containing protein n=1 Tax=Pseudogymnoascus verrucosus TaxID=342668 RepID=A0A1B8GFR9_9PEZI|nr:uncharacterized protein VE01_06197 [Pseudogymnoascus verrucosus]OBT94675.1 hypothetical protein VE01_06197 [Pseudogymnoascus verrucosus]